MSLAHARIMGAEAMRARLGELSARWAELMGRGCYAQAWQLCDAALAAHAGIDCSSWPRHEQFIWNGTAVRDRRVLVRCYRGYGDTVQMARFLPRLHRQARHVAVWAPALLHPLLRRIGGVDRLEPLHEGHPGIDCDVDLEICELAHVFRVSRAELPHTVPYLAAARPAPRFTRAPRVGLVWQSGAWDPLRSVPWSGLLPLRTVPGVHWLILQRGPGLRSWGGEFGSVPAIRDLIDELNGLASLDLLITVDTFSAHLAGALGVPVWLLLHSRPDWRWGAQGGRTPWYPSMRLLRQSRPGDWRPLVRRVRRDLLSMLHSARTRTGSRTAY